MKDSDWTTEAAPACRSSTSIARQEVTISLIFVSHSSRNNSEASALIDELTPAGIKSFFLDFDPVFGIPGGRSWEEEIHRSLRRASAVLLLLTPEWQASKWCFAEAKIARTLGKPVIAIKIAATAIDPTLAVDQILDRTTGESSEISRQRLLTALRAVGLDPASAFTVDATRPPYPGLFAFERQDAAVFFGREPEIKEAQERLAQLSRFGKSRWLILVGASGCGKSSLLRGGLLPRLRDDWIVVGPWRAQSSPTNALSEALLAAGLPGPLASARDQLDKLGDLLCQLRVTLGKPASKVLVAVDQLEELLDGSNAANRTLERLRNSDALLVATLRSDFLAKFQAHAATQPLPIDLLPITSMSHARFGEVITGPAQQVGLVIQPPLVQAMLAESPNADALPLLAFALREFWEHDHTKGELTATTYRDVIGGVTGSLARAAEGAMRGASAEEIEGVRRAFLLLASAGDDTAYRRKRVPSDRLPAAARERIECLVRARLLVSDQDGVEVVHEALFRVWPRLKAWLDEETTAKFLSWRKRFERSYSEWLRRSRHRSERLRGVSLGEAREWLASHGDLLNADERGFITWSERIERRTQGVMLVVGMSILALVGSLWLGARRASNTAEAGRLAMAEALARTFYDRGETLFERERDAAAAARLVAKAVALAPANAKDLSLYANRLVHLILMGPVMTGVTAGGAPRSVAISRDGRTVLSVAQDHVAHVMRLQESSPAQGLAWKELLTIPRPKALTQDYERRFQLSPNGRWVLQRWIPPTLFDTDNSVKPETIDGNSSFSFQPGDGALIVSDKSGKSVVRRLEAGVWREALVLQGDEDVTDSHSLVSRREVRGRCRVSMVLAGWSVALPFGCEERPALHNTNDSADALAVASSQGSNIEVSVWKASGLAWKRDLEDVELPEGLHLDQRGDRVAMVRGKQVGLLRRGVYEETECDGYLEGFWWEEHDAFVCVPRAGGITLASSRHRFEDIEVTAGGNLIALAILRDAKKSFLLGANLRGQLAVYDPEARAALASHIAGPPVQAATFVGGDGIMLPNEQVVVWSGDRSAARTLARPPGWAMRVFVVGDDSRWVGWLAAGVDKTSIWVLDRQSVSLRGPLKNTERIEWFIDSRGDVVLPADGDGSWPMARGGRHGIARDSSSNPVLVDRVTKERLQVRPPSSQIYDLIGRLLLRSQVIDFDNQPGVYRFTMLDDRDRRFTINDSFRGSQMWMETPQGRVAILPGGPSFFAGSPDRSDMAVSDDGRLVGEAIGATAQVWLSSGVKLTAEFRHPTEVLAVRFIKREVTTYLQTICADGGVREWFVYEEFRDKPSWAEDVAAFNHGMVLGDDGSEKLVPGLMLGAERTAVLSRLRASGSPAAQVVSRHFSVP